MSHPLHPILVHLPVGLWPTSFLFDVGFLLTGQTQLAAVAYYTMLIGAIGALIAIPAGLAEYVQIPRGTYPRRIATVHMLISGSVTALYIVNLVARYSLEGSVPASVTGGHFVLSLISLLLLGVTGYLGGLLVYDQGVGFKPQLRDHEHGDENEEIRRAA